MPASSVPDVTLVFTTGESVVPKEFAGESAATVLLCQLSYTFREGTWQDSNLRPSKEPSPSPPAKVSWTSSHSMEEADSSSSSSCAAKPVLARKPVFLRAVGTLIKSAICSSSQRFGTVRLV